MGKIITQVKMTNVMNKAQSLEFSAVVDTGATHLTLPMAWRKHFTDVDFQQDSLAEIADGSTVEGELAGPFLVEIGDGLSRANGDVFFMDMKPNERGDYEVLLGHLALQYGRLGVDMLNHRLFKVNYVDCKGGMKIRPRKVELKN
jgi:hypothetical protein